MANSSNTLYFLCLVHAEKKAVSKPGPLNLALLIDASGSMGGEGKLDEAKEAAKMFVDGLREDFLSVYSFSDSVKEIVPPQVVSNKGKVNNAIDNIDLEGGTALFHALRQVRDNLKRTKTTSMTNRLIVITDGCPTSDEQMFSSNNEWKQYSEKFALETLEKSVSITAIGVGSDYNETILSALAAKSGGEFKHIKSASELKGYLQQQLYSLQKIVADNCILHIVLTPGSECTAFSHRNVLCEGDDVKIQLGSLEEGSMEIAGEIALGPKLPGIYRIARVFLEYDDPFCGAIDVRTDSVNMIANPTDRMDLIMKGRNDKVINRVSTYRIANETIQAIQTGRPSEITRKIDELTQRHDLDAETKRELLEQQQTGRLDLKQLLSTTQRFMEGKQKEGEA